MLGFLAAALVSPLRDLGSVASALGRAATSVGVLRLVTLTLAQALDLATFSLMVTRHGVAAEANPVVQDLFWTYGLPAVALAKLALVVLIGSLCVAARSRGGRGLWTVVGGVPLALAIAAGLIGGITNAATLLA